ncbi:Uncharacterized protein APZ42_029145 [Daphnia magna]|uniref:Uncharacterized protein n=1 Tax=Daphnia magna TaxID=35525 RepID=A0A0P5SRI0_9CRUS|nr:Uncharacterized protein APZ42_029145 [Daphnia magna]
MKERKTSFCVCVLALSVLISNLSISSSRLLRFSSLYYRLTKTQSPGLIGKKTVGRLP